MLVFSSFAGREPECFVSCDSDFTREVLTTFEQHVLYLWHTFGTPFALFCTSSCPHMSFLGQRREPEPFKVLVGGGFMQQHGNGHGLNLYFFLPWLGTGTCLSIKLMIFLINYNTKMHFPHDVNLLWGHLHVNLCVNQIRSVLAPLCLHLTYFCGRFYEASGLCCEVRKVVAAWYWMVFLQRGWCSRLEGIFFFFISVMDNSGKSWSNSFSHQQQHS